MEDAEAEAETGTEKRAGGARRLTAHPIDAAAAAAVGGPVTAGPAPTKEESNNDAGHPTAQTIGAAPAALAGGTVRAGPAPSIRDAQRKEGGNETPRSAQAETDTANEATEESAPPRAVACA